MQTKKSHLPKLSIVAKEYKIFFFGQKLFLCYCLDVCLTVYLTFCSYVGDVEINVEVKRYFCKAGVKGIQVSFNSYFAMCLVLKHHTMYQTVITIITIAIL